jgi:predicted nucleic acid-binding protein
MIVLDTNVLSALMNKTPDRAVVDWLDRQPRKSIWTTSVTVLEIGFGLQIMALGKRRSTLLANFEALMEKIDHRVVSFDGAAAQESGSLMTACRKQGRSIDLRDTMIAGIVLANHATLATRNTAHFQDISARIVNPWSA